MQLFFALPICDSRRISEAQSTQNGLGQFDVFVVSILKERTMNAKGGHSTFSAFWGRPRGSERGLQSELDGPLTAAMSNRPKRVPREKTVTQCLRFGLRFGLTLTNVSTANDSAMGLATQDRRSHLRAFGQQN